MLLKPGMKCLLSRYHNGTGHMNGMNDYLKRKKMICPKCRPRIILLLDFLRN